MLFEIPPKVMDHYDCMFGFDRVLLVQAGQTWEFDCELRYDMDNRPHHGISGIKRFLGIKEGK